MKGWTAGIVMGLALLLGAACTAQAQEANVPAVWTAKELHFVYQGFTSHYTCSGLRDRLRTVLLELGARKDLQITESGCAGGSGSPSPFPGVNAKLQVLQPLVGKSAPAGTQPVMAHWKSVDLAARHDPLEAAGDCELIEQIKASILPLFTTRNLEYSSTCVPHQLQVGGTKLKAEVLVSATAAAPAQPAAGASGS